MMATDIVYDFSSLPEEIVECILLKLSPYNELESAMQVCRMWRRLVPGIIRKLQLIFRQCVADSDLSWVKISPEAGSMITERYSHCACYYDKSAYIFGGCTFTNTTFNDLWRFDLSARQWVRPLAMGTYPSPKACASMVTYRDSLVLFGGWSHPTPYPLHQAARFFSELHIYCPINNRWSHVMTQSCPKPTAGHSASVVGDKMVVFGGSHSAGVGCSDVLMFDFLDMTWHEKRISISVRKPSPRYGQSQITLDDQHILIVGGCGGPNQIFNDIWMLNLNTEPWSWTEINISNSEYSAPQLWCHPACKTGDMVVVLSKAAKTSVNRPGAGGPNPGQPHQAIREMPAPRDEDIHRLPRHHIQNRNQGMNVHSRRGMTKRRLTDGDSSSTDEFSDEDGNRNGAPSATPRYRLGASPAENRPGTTAHEPGSAGARPGLPSIRPNAMKDRQKQLEMLRKYEERLRNLARPSRSSQENNEEKGANADNISLFSREPQSPMLMHVLDISNVVETATVTWNPIRDAVPANVPDETIFYSLVEGRGELIMFGGIQRDMNSMQRGGDIKNQCHTVSNNIQLLGASHKLS